MLLLYLPRIVQALGLEVLFQSFDGCAREPQRLHGAEDLFKALEQGLLVAYSFL